MRLYVACNAPLKCIELRMAMTIFDRYIVGYSNRRKSDRQQRFTATQHALETDVIFVENSW